MSYPIVYSQLYNGKHDAEQFTKERLHGLFIPWTICTMDYSYHGRFVLWTFRTICKLFSQHLTVGEKVFLQAVYQMQVDLGVRQVICMCYYCCDLFSVCTLCWITHLVDKVLWWNVKYVLAAYSCCALRCRHPEQIVWPGRYLLLFSGI